MCVCVYITPPVNTFQEEELMNKVSLEVQSFKDTPSIYECVNFHLLYFK